MMPVFRFASFASRAFTVAIALFAAAAFGQEAPPGNEPGFSASLLLVKADWSKSESAISISEDLQKALKDEPVPGELRGRLPASATTILFPAETALVYSREHYWALREWLKTKDLIVESEAFDSKLIKVGPQQEKYYQLTLTKSLDLFGLSLSRPAADQTFVSTKVALTWSVGNQPRLNSENAVSAEERWSVMRELTTSEKPRGQEEYLNRQMQDHCSFFLPLLKDDQVAIVPAFPARNDATFQMAARQQGFTALLVLEANSQRADTGVEPRLFLPDKVERLTVTKFQNAQNLWLAGGRETNSPRYVISRDVMISWSEARDVAWGFSKTLGTWAKQEIQPPADDTRGLVVDDELAVWRVGSAYYAFSGKAASWDVLRLPEGHTPPQVLDSGFARVHDGDDLFTFSATTGRWSSPTGSRVGSNADAGGIPGAGAPEGAVIPGPGGFHGPEASEELPGKQIAVFHLKYLQAATADRLIRQLFPVSVAADERTNRVVVSGSSGTIEKIKTMLTEIDRETAQPSNSAAGPATKGSEWAFEWAVEDPKALAGKYEAKEREAQRLAGQIRELQTAPKEHELRIKELTEKLNQAVADAFRARQQVHQAELGQLRQRLAGVEQTLKTRERLSKEIIDKRVKDLLNPDLQWEAAATSPAAASAANTLNEKTELFARLHDDPQWIENAKEDFKRATTDEDRKSALEVQLSWWQDIVKALRRLEQLGEKIDEDLAHAQAGAKKTEAEIAAVGGEKSPGAASAATGLPKVTVGGWGPESEQMWAALGLTVQKVTREDAPDPKLVGGMKITAVSADSPAKGLEVGDIVQSMMLTGSFPDVRRATLQVVRGNEHFPVYVEFPSAATATTAARPASAAWPADSAARSGPKSQAWPPQPTAPSILLNAGGQTVTLRSPDEFRKELREAEQGVSNIKALKAGIDPTGKGETVTQRERESAEKNLPSWERRLEWVREQYAAQIHLLELEVKDAASAMEAAQKAEQFVRSLRERNRGAVSSSQVNEAQRALETAQLRLEKANTLLDLYRKADPKPAEGATLPGTPVNQSEPADRAAAQKVRDVLRQRVEVLNRMFKSGQMNHLEYLRSVVQLDDAEIAAAPSVEERKKAQQSKVDHLKESLEIARRLYSAGELTYADLLAYQAELLRAGGEIKAPEDDTAQPKPQAAPAEAPKKNEKPPRGL